jgi:hypothetical protein
MSMKTPHKQVTGIPRALKILALTALCQLSIFSTAFAKGGALDGGGGEPGALEFVKIAYKLSNWLENKNFPQLPWRKVRGQADEIMNSLNRSEDEQLLVFSEEEIECQVGDKVLRKMACTEQGKITVNRRAWQAASGQEKVELVSLELLVLSQATQRYKLATEIGEYADEILKTDPSLKPGKKSSHRNDIVLAAENVAEITLTLKEDINVKPGNDIIYFFDNRVAQASMQIMLDGNNPQQKEREWLLQNFGPEIKDPNDHRATAYGFSLCFLQLRHKNGGVLRRGRSFLSGSEGVYRPIESHGDLIMRIEGLGSLSCSKISSEESKKRRKALGRGQPSLTAREVERHVGSFFEFSVEVKAEGSEPETDTDF